MRMVIFAHGLESGPDGRKARALREAGLQVLAPDGRGKPLAARLVDLEAVVGAHPDAVLVGSSYGGLAALLVAHAGRPLAGLVLLAPAVTLREPPNDDPDRLRVPVGLPAAIVHGLRDEVVPVEVSRALAVRCPHVRLHTPDDGHDLHGAIPLVLEVVRQLAIGPA